ncbi:alpha/beta fold hydrolase [Marinobacterium aestuariivivens]|uniref:Alpha/beta fold hydrolase n=1 Tax=Marinobacterium aestuariivivens TaxID=1698799 RepID=A0ABW2A5L1_9GAMM
MHHPFKVETRRLHQPDQHLVYRLYRNPAIETGRRLVLLHGAGVAGVDTWHALIASLDQWSEILVPDQRGTGETLYPDGKEHPFRVQELVADLNALLDQLGWWQFDLGGYSMGGLVAMLFKQQHPDRVQKQYLLESAVLDRPDWTGTVELRKRYSQAAGHLRGSDAAEGVYQFLDAISPARKIKPESERLMVSRLASRAGASPARWMP